MEFKNNNLSYLDRYVFWLSILNNISLARLYANVYSNSSYRKKEIEEKMKNFEILLCEINISLEKIKKELKLNICPYSLIPDKKDIDDKLYIKNKKVEYGKVCFTLTTGRYTVGMDIPEGRYRIVAKKNYGNIYNKYDTFDENLNAEDKDSPKIHKRLIIGDILIITDSLIAELSSKKANLLQNITRRPIGKEITLKAGNYICGEDFKSGVYDIKRIKNSGVVSFDDNNEYFGSEDYGLKEIKNYLFKTNHYLGISGGLVINLVPSQNNYIK
ncbi:hypothetical protein OCK72_06705 [Fusobacterium simiae]|uniref:Uncharacterized protein n=2 Tax=Fusobacterium simiae TaxID=855 RepID=A0ABT4DM25_FUSSI|nr:hypothetical protein [Fusobacterium simiae]MCY7008344.1 hypothetical protein [Fusobacterium simiae]